MAPSSGAATLTAVGRAAVAAHEALFFLPARPWLGLYGQLVRRPGAADAADVAAAEALPSILRLPEELTLEILSRLPAESLARAACVCRPWRYAARHPVLWRRACLQAWPLCPLSEHKALLAAHYRSSWRHMFLSRPRLRTGGLYVSRNTYVKTGVRDMSTHHPVHLVVYYRYLRFDTDGKCLYKISAERVGQVSKLLRAWAPGPRADKDTFTGRYAFQRSPAAVAGAGAAGDAGPPSPLLEVTVVYPGRQPTEVRTALNLRSTAPGAFNRLDILSLVSGPAADEGVAGAGAGAGGPADSVRHTRGLTTYVFVPWEEASTHVLDLPIEKLDYFFPG